MKLTLAHQADDMGELDADATGFAGSSCTQAWRWNLKYVAVEPVLVNDDWRVLLVTKIQGPGAMCPVVSGRSVGVHVNAPARVRRRGSF